MEHSLGLQDLPVEIIDQVFAFLLPNELFAKLIEPYAWSNFNAVQLAAYERIFLANVIVKSKVKKHQYSLMHYFYPEAVRERSFVITGFAKGYDVVRNLIYYNIENRCHTIPREIGLLFSFESSESMGEAQNLGKLLEILAFDNYYKDSIPRISVQILYEKDPTGPLTSVSDKTMEKIENLGNKIFKFLIRNKFSVQTQVNNLHLLRPSSFYNLEEVHFWNNGITDYTLRTYFKSLPPKLRILDLSMNNILRLDSVILPPLLEKLMVNANNLVSLEGLNYQEAVNLHTLDASINAIKSIEGIRFPESLKVLKVTYNLILTVSQDQIPPFLEVLALSKNNIKTIDNIDIPATLVELHLSENSIRSFAEGFFSLAANLQLIDLSDNRIDDLDDLGTLPASLSELKLDNNEIDNSNLSNVLTHNLTKLSMVNTGLVSIDNVRFPKTMKEVILAKNEIFQVNNVVFGSDSFVKLDLSNNRLKTFHSVQNNLVIPPSLKSLDLRSNMVSDLADFTFTSHLESLSLNGYWKDALTNDTVKHFPCSLKVLNLAGFLDSRTIHDLDIDFKVFPNLETLVLEHNGIRLIEKVQYPASLQSISYAHNKIEHLHFNQFPTTIRRVDFNHNLVKELKTLPYFPNIQYMGVCGDQTDLIRLGIFFAKT